MKRKVYEWQICFIFMYLLILTVCNSKLMKCIEGNSVSFECPCCSKKFNDCRFKKLFQGGYIVRDGVLSAQNFKYKFNEKKTHIILKECNEDDVGTYVWMYAESNVNTLYDLLLKVQKVSDEILLCFVGGKVSFECPCCAEEINFCKFKKNSQDGYIVRNGALNHHIGRYELNDKKTNITLKECNEDDEGTYFWICRECDVIKQFQLQVPKFRKDMKCPVGGQVSFECPCPQELDSCRFEKLEEERQIVLYSVFNIHKRYAHNEHKTHITLNECDEDDEGTYVWMCGRCNVNWQFHLEVQALEIQDFGHNQDATRSKTGHLNSYLMPFAVLFIPILFCFLVCFVMFQWKFMKKFFLK